MSARPTAASGRPTTPAAPGSPSSMSSRRSRSGRSQWRPRIPTSSMWQAARGCIDRTCRSATASTAPPMAAGAGRTAASPTGSRLRSWPSIRAIPHECSPRFSATPMARAPSAASTLQRTPESAGNGFCTAMRTPAVPRSPSIRCSRRSCMRRCGRRVSAPGRTRTSSRAPRAACSSRPTAGRPGRASARACRRTCRRSTLRSRRARRGACMPRWGPMSPVTTPRRRDWACFAPTTPARAGSASPRTPARRCASAAAICPWCASIPAMRMSSTAPASSP